MGVKQKLKSPFVLLAVICLLTRIPFASKTLYHLDSVQFALALHHFDVSLHQPQPPGYILYVTFGKIFRHFIGNDNTALVSASIFFSAASAVALFLLIQLLTDGKTSLLAAVFYLSSPLVWFHGEVAFSYIVEGFFSTVIALFCFLYVKRQHYSHICYATFFLGLSGGVRQNTLPLLLPLWLYSMMFGLSREKNATRFTKHVFLQAGFLYVIFLSWFIPMILLSGGFQEYFSALNRQSASVLRTFSIFGGGLKALIHNGAFILYYFFCSFTLSTFLLICYAYIYLKNFKLDTQNSRLILLWFLPSLLFYLTIHVNNPGYIFTFLPALFIVLGKSFMWLRENTKESAFLSITALLFSANLFFFLVPSGVQTSFPEIHAHDENLIALTGEIKKHFPPDKTIILSFNHFYYGFRHAMVYLPRYTSYQVALEAAYDGHVRKFLGGDEYRFKNFEHISIHPRIKYIVLFADSSIGMARIMRAVKRNNALYKQLRRNTVLRHTTLPMGFNLYWYESAR